MKTEVYKPQPEHVFRGFLFFPAIAGDMAKPHVLPGQLYDNINSYNYQMSDYYNAKWFATEKEAMEALDRARERVFYDTLYALDRLNDDYLKRLQSKIKELLDQ